MAVPSFIKNNSKAIDFIACTALTFAMPVYLGKSLKPLIILQSSLIIINFANRYFESWVKQKLKEEFDATIKLNPKKDAPTTTIEEKRAEEEKLHFGEGGIAEFHPSKDKIDGSNIIHSILFCLRNDHKISDLKHYNQYRTYIIADLILNAVKALGKLSITNDTFNIDFWAPTTSSSTLFKSFSATPTYRGFDAFSDSFLDLFSESKSNGDLHYLKSAISSAAVTCLALAIYNADSILLGRSLTSLSTNRFFISTFANGFKFFIAANIASSSFEKLSSVVQQGLNR